jgi:hypothetical protein
LAIYIYPIIATLALEAMELAIDTTYSTNNARMELFAILAEVGRTGVPLSYLFLKTLPLENGEKNKNQGAITYILDQFLRPLKTLPGMHGLRYIIL